MTKKFEEKDNTGVAFQNDKGDNENRPDFRGHLLVNGKKVAVSIWVKTAQGSGKEYLSLALSEWREPAKKDDLFSE